MTLALRSDVRKNRTLEDLVAELHLDLGDPRIGQAVDAYMRNLEVAAGDAARRAATAAAIVAAIPWDDLAKAFTAQMAAALTAVAESSGARGGFLLDNPYAQAWAKTYAGELVTQINAQTRQALQHLVTQSLKLGVPPAQLAASIHDLVGPNLPQMQALGRLADRLVADGIPWGLIEQRLARETDRMIRFRSMMIARTELTTAQAYGLEASWRATRDLGALPATAVKVWIASKDEKCTDGSCPALHGKYAPIGGLFPDGTYAPAKHPLCRCTMGLKVLSERQYRAYATQYGWSTT